MSGRSTAMARGARWFKSLRMKYSKRANFHRAIALGHADVFAEIGESLRACNPDGATPKSSACAGHPNPKHSRLSTKRSRLRLLRVVCSRPRRANSICCGWAAAIEGIQHPFIERAIVFKLQGTQRVGNPLNGVGYTMRKVVHRVDTPLVSGAMMRHFANAIERGVSHRAHWAKPCRS